MKQPKLSLPDALEFIKCVRFDGNICILASLAIREVLRRFGFAAEVKSVALQVRAWDGEILLHTLGVGLNALWDEPYRGRDWDGHLVVSLPGLIIDPIFYNARRSSWEWTPAVAVVNKQGAKGYGIETTRRILPAVAVWREQHKTFRFEAIWAATPANRGWMNAPDYINSARRRELADEIMSGLEPWKSQRET